MLLLLANILGKILSYQIITTNQQLNDYCHQIKDINCIALDSEFIRTRTFYPQLGLIQLFDGSHTILIDPLNITDWYQFKDFIEQQKLEKYFHACSEDIEVFCHQFGAPPLPIVDSQILASFLDNPLSTGYATLVKKYLDIDLDKSETRTDWLQRPLSEKQCQYAANDVFYLLPLVTKLKALLQEKGWLTAAYQECANIVKRRCEVTRPEQAYLQIKNAWQLNSNQLGYLQKLAQWRFSYAIEHDIALNFVVHEDVLWKLAYYQPTSLGELSALGMKGKEIRLFGQMLLAMRLDPNDDILPIRRIITYPDYKKWATVIKDAANLIAQQTDLSKELLVSRRHIDQFVKWVNGEMPGQSPDLLSSWRAELFKPYLDII